MSSIVSSHLASQVFVSRLLYASAFAIHGFAIHGCDVAAASTPFTATPTGYDIASSEPAIAWLDGNHVIFVGKKSNPDPKKSSLSPSKMYLWSESTKSVREYSEATNFCFADGRISYGIQKNDEFGKAVTLRYAGPFGAEVLMKESPVSSSGPNHFSKFSCKVLSGEFAPPMPKDRLNLVLREGDGYLALRPMNSKDYLAYPRNITLYRAKGAAPVTLPITWDETVGGWGTTYSDHKRAYVLPPQDLVPSKPGNNWPSSEPRVVYLLTATDGKVDRVVIPPTAIFRFPRPIKMGWIYGGGSVKERGSTGLYFYDGAKQIKVEVGGIYGIAVSPDGCKAAVAINNFAQDMGTPTPLKIFNFCAERK